MFRVLKKTSLEVLFNQDPFIRKMEAPRTPRMARMRGAASSDSGFASSSMGDNTQPGLAVGGGGGGLQVRCNCGVVLQTDSFCQR